MLANSKIRTLIYLFASGVLSILLTNCRQESSHSDHAASDTTHASSSKYVCPMHPQVTSDKPGKCPICGMDLVKSSNGSLKLTTTQERLANISVQRPATGIINAEPLFNAKVVANEDRRAMISSRVAGRIEKLYIRETGRQVQKGQPLYELYSEQLNGDIQEYLILKDQFTKLGDQNPHYSSLVKGAESKLMLYGLTKGQVEKLTAGTSRILILSPASGTITDALVSEGQYVQEGTLMFRLDDLAKLWLETELYPNESDQFKTGDSIMVHLSNSKDIYVQVSFLTPVYRETTQVVVMRAAFDNSAGEWLPGMQATVQRLRKGRSVLQLPIDAVIRSGKNSHAFVRTADHTFEMRMVTTGAENANAIEIIDGITAGDEVVTSGAYLLYSELILRNGADFMAHIH
ncbi:MAG: efflux RND transporter periplasmic adaptor subunit [Chryseolinea sp.]